VSVLGSVANPRRFFREVPAAAWARAVARPASSPLGWGCELSGVIGPEG